jgi:hypothetical protein
MPEQRFHYLPTQAACQSLHVRAAPLKGSASDAHLHLLDSRGTQRCQRLNQLDAMLAGNEYWVGRSMARATQNRDPVL